MSTSPMILTTAPAFAWRKACLSLALLWALILLLYWPTAQNMVGIWWRSDTYAHCLIVLPAAFWLAWRQRHALSQETPQASWPTLLILAAASVSWLLGDLVSVNVITQFALMTLVIFAVPTVLGWRVAKRLAFPLAFAYLAVPVGDFMMPQLMTWTADFTVAALRMSGIPVYREGLQFIIPSGSWSVVEACSGIRYLMASFTVGCLFAYLNYRSLKKRIIFMGVAMLVPLLANWLRAYLIVMLGHLSGNELATGVDHLIYGWVFFGLVITAMFMLGARWADREEGDQAVMPHANQMAHASVSMGVLAAAMLMVALPHLASWHLQSQVNTAAVELADVATVGAWQRVPTQTKWVPAFEHANQMVHSAWQHQNGTKVGSHVAYYRDQNYVRKLVSSTQLLVRSGDAQWARVQSDGVVRVDGDVSFASSVLRQQSGVITSDAQRLTVWQAFWVDGELTPRPMTAKVIGAIQKLKGRGDDGAIVVLYTLGTGEAAQADLRAFWRDQGHELLEALRSTQSQQ